MAKEARITTSKALKDLEKLFEEIDSNPNLFYRACNAKENTLLHCSLDCEQTEELELDSDFQLSKDATLRKNKVYRNGVYTMQKLEDLLFCEYLTTGEFPEGGSTLRIIEGKLIQDNSEVYLGALECIVKPKEIVKEFQLFELETFLKV